MIRLTLLTLILTIYWQSVSAQEPVVGGPCQGCEFVFVDMPEELKANSSIAPISEKGEALELKGTVYKPDGTPAGGIIVYAYQTDANGRYPKGSTAHGSLRGWALSDHNGQYRFKTIRPKAYPGRDIPQHIHVHVIEPGKATYYIDDVTFDDDPLLTSEHRQNKNCRGGCGESHPERDEQGVWQVRRDITLGESIPDYK